MKVEWTHEPSMRRFYRWYAVVAREGVWVAVLKSGRRFVAEPIRTTPPCNICPRIDCPLA